MRRSCEYQSQKNMNSITSQYTAGQLQQESSKVSPMLGVSGLTPINVECASSTAHKETTDLIP